ncbi:arylesterase [Candidatus Magnetaquicoccus inordinatus]|uniref:arylesterase n=1 Tax=Candidatus Magnetaquicoccus inordinatus TaxID=2496818 RepID=UPI00187D17E0|nr:arylesterase [Candidatus Magnetaquicoccus inordinatus]
MLSFSHPAAAEPRILCFGDSLTAGYGVASGADYPSLLQQRLREKGFAHRVINAGISGETTAGGLRRLLGLLQQPPTLAIVALGANDGLRGLSTQEMKHNLSEIVRQLKQAGVRPVLAGMRVPPNYGRRYSDEFAAVFTQLAKEHQIPLLPFLLARVAGEATLNLDDGIHPNAAGYRQVLENVWETLHPLLP